ncbi:MAG: hypothetical protein D6743_16845 [Calditrichaeota bacterium]|nr:MAG: hypothetical protein D6743_16845 [Calditrichota bacterium]
MQSELSVRRVVVSVPALLAFFAVGFLSARYPVLGLIVMLALVFSFVTRRKPLWIIYLWLFSSIFYAYRLDVGQISLNSYRVFFLLALVTVILQPRTTRLSFDGKTVTRVVLMLGIFIFSWLRSPLDARPITTSHLLLLCFWLAMFTFLLVLVDDRDKWEKVVQVFLVTSSFLAIYGLYQAGCWLVTGKVPLLPFSDFLDAKLAHETAWSQVAGYGIPRVASFFNDQNVLAIYLTIAVLFLLTYLEKTKLLRRRLFLGILVVVHAACVAFTFSRSGVFLLVFSLFVYQLRRFVRSRGKAQGGTLVTILGLVSVALLFLLFPALVTETDLLVNAFQSRLVDVQAGRVSFLSTAFDIFARSPFLGQGMRQMLHKGHYIIYTAHSFYLTVLASYGLVGAIVFGAFFWPVLRRGFVMFWKPDSGALDVCVSLSILVLFAFLVVYDSLFLEMMVLPSAILYRWATLAGTDSVGAF